MCDLESESQESEGEFAVEKIVNHKFVEGKCFFLLKWKGYKDEDSSWEEESSLNCPYLLAEYIHLNEDRIEADREAAKNIYFANIKKRLTRRKQVQYDSAQKAISSESKEPKKNTLFSQKAKSIVSESIKNSKNKNQFHTEKVTKQREDSESVNISRKINLARIRIRPEPCPARVAIIGRRYDQNGIEKLVVGHRNGTFEIIPTETIKKLEPKLYIRFLEDETHPLLL